VPLVHPQSYSLCTHVWFIHTPNIFFSNTQITGGELFERICEKESYTEHEARLLVQVLLQTLAFLHNKSIAHRDLKPENLLLKSADDDSQIVLADFGFATKCKGKSLNQVCGTPGKSCVRTWHLMIYISVFGCIYSNALSSTPSLCIRLCGA
jgi:calcium/calmodulin-dependent protein kinase I